MPRKQAALSQDDNRVAQTGHDLIHEDLSARDETTGTYVPGLITIVGFATQGEHSGDANRLRTLLSGVAASMYPFGRMGKGKQFLQLMKFLHRQRPDLVVMEGTGIAGGLALMLAKIMWGVRYVVSSGDAVGPFVRMFHPVLGIGFSFYERLLCRLAAGFIGWTPYLTGRALTFGTPYAMTAPGWAQFHKSNEELLAGRSRIRRMLGISDDVIVIGIAGSLQWNSRVGYCYGYELVQAVKRTDRLDIAVLVVGDGDGRNHLEELSGEDLGRRVFLTGRVAREEVPDYLAAMDIGSLPQSLDGVGSFRYTTKISEYVAAGLPIVTGHLPMTYDLNGAWFWRLPGRTPWGEVYIAALADFMGGVSVGVAEERKSVMQVPLHVAVNFSLFRRNEQIDKVTAFLEDLLMDAQTTGILGLYHHPNITRDTSQ